MVLIFDFFLYDLVHQATYVDSYNEMLLRKMNANIDFVLRDHVDLV